MAVKTERKVKASKKNQKGAGVTSLQTKKMAQESSDSSEDDSDSSVEDAKTLKKQTVNSVKVPNDSAESSEETSDSDDSDSEEEVPTKPAKKTIASPKPIKASEDDSSEEDSSEDDNSEDDSSGDDSSEEVAVPSQKRKAETAMVMQPRTKKAKSETSDESSEDDSEDEKAVQAQKRKGKVPTVVTAKKTKVAKSGSAHDESSGSDESSSSSSEDMELGDEKAQKRKGKEAIVVTNKKTKVDKSESTDDESSGSDESSSEEEDMEVGSEKEICTIFIKNLPKKIDDKKIIKFFRKNGISFNGNLRRDNAKQACSADLEDADDLEKALALSGRELKGIHFTVEKALAKGQKKIKEKQDFHTAKEKLKSASRKETDESENVTLFVKNLSSETTEQDVKKCFGPGVKEVRMPVRPDGTIKGFAFVEFSNESEVESAIEDKQGTELKGNALLLDFAGKKQKQNKSKNKGEPGESKVLFVKNLSFDTTKESLEEAFEGCESARIATNRDTGASRGFGFVDFTTVEAAKAAFESLQGTEIDGREIVLDFASEISNTPNKSGGGNRGGRGRGRGNRGSPGGRGGHRASGGCFNCGEDGHFSRDCPKEKKGSGGCFNCGEDGHFSRECPKEKKGGGSCFNCGEDGHFSRECPKEKKGGGGCFNCGENGHFSRDCTKERKGGRGGRGGGRGGRGGRGGGRGRGGRGGGQFEAKAKNKGNIQEFKGSKKTFD